MKSGSAGCDRTLLDASSLSSNVRHFGKKNDPSTALTAWLPACPPLLRASSHHRGETASPSVLAGLLKTNTHRGVCQD